MKSTFALAVALFGATIIAAPVSSSSSPHITFSLTNDYTGHNAQATILADGTFFGILSLFTNTNIDEDGLIIASSAQLIQFQDDVVCSFNAGGNIIPISGKKTFTNLGTDASKLVDLSDFTVQCQI
jgi:hypothetical protein